METRYFAPVARGLESLLAGELKALGAAHVRQVRAGVSFAGPLETAYRACLWSRLASRILLPLTVGPAGDADELYETVRRIDWDAHLGVDDTFVVDFTGRSDEIRDTRFGAVRVKDAIADRFRDRHGGRRPSVDARAPDVRANAHLARGKVTIGLDLSGESLHRRGYREERAQVEAPLKETLAAAVLLFAAWPQEAAAGGSFLDPLCGSGTLPIEAALMAADIAPGLLRAGAGHTGGVHSTGRASAARGAAQGGGREASPGFAFTRWRGHDEALWRRLVAEAEERREAGLGRLAAAAPGLTIHGSDRDAGAVRLAEACVRRAGLAEVVAIERAELADARPTAPSGLLAANAPYGERLGERETALAVSRQLGERLRSAFGGWRAAVLGADRRQAEALGLQIVREAALTNGPLDCLLAYVDADRAPTAAGAGAGTGPAAATPADAPRSPRSAARSSAHMNESRPQDRPDDGAAQFANRLRKNRRRLARRLRREGITCYRLYDADLPDYNVVVDVYGDRVHVQEYKAPPEIDEAKASRRLEDALEAIAEALELPARAITLKERRRQRGTAQYTRRARSGAFFAAQEDELSYLVNLEDYLDTGLFIDQRLTRRLVRRLAGGRRFLNLFAYTGTMTVNALAGGSPASATVDLSATYLDWAGRNLAANGFDAVMEVAAAASEAAGSAPPPSAHAAHRPAHRLVRADCLRWVAEAEGGYDLIWLDPPTFSNSKRMGRAVFDVQRDHADLIRMTARRLLAPGGILLFATNRHGFRLDGHSLGDLAVTDLSLATLPFDCERSAARHHVYRIEAPAQA